MSRTISVRLTDGQAKALLKWLKGCLEWLPAFGKKSSTIAAMEKLIRVLEET